MSITLDQLCKVFPTTKREKLALYVDPINITFARFNVNSLNAKAMFLAQIGHESANLTVFVENLNYSADGLRKIFGKYFTPALAAAYARQPEKIANRVYANRMGNGDEASGDGWRYRGKGAIQITGASNTKAFAAFIERSVEDTVAYLLTPEGAILSAGWFFASNGLVAFADKGDLLTVTKRINGGTNGLQDRTDIYARAKKALA